MQLGLAAVVLVGAVAGELSPWQIAAGSLSSTHLRMHVLFLSDPLLEGRRAGSRGEATAALYVATELERSGLAVTRRAQPSPLALVRQGRLIARRGNVTVELQYGLDFTLLSVPPQDVLDLEDPTFEQPSLADWLREGQPRGSARLTLLRPSGAPRLAIAPPAVRQVKGARVTLHVEIDRTPIAPFAVEVLVPGREQCERLLEAHHDGFGPDFPGAADGAAGVALLLEVARALASAKARPRCSVRIRSRGDGEWVGPHPAPPVPDLAARRAHTPRDRAQDWDWEDLKRRAQATLVQLGEGR
jgi:hypothetical protein